MNFDDYRNKLPYPRKTDFSTVFYYKGGKVVHSLKAGDATPLPPETTGAVREVVIDEGGYRAAFMAYQNETTRLRNLFEDDVKKDLGIIDHPKAGLLLDKAWELGHSSGFSEVYNYASDLVDLIR
jgi:hypothetical protein